MCNGQYGRVSLENEVRAQAWPVVCNQYTLQTSGKNSNYCPWPLWPQITSVQSMGTFLHCTTDVFLLTALTQSGAVLGERKNRLTSCSWLQLQDVAAFGSPQCSDKCSPGTSPVAWRKNTQAVKSSRTNGFKKFLLLFMLFLVQPALDTVYASVEMIF